MDTLFLDLGCVKNRQWVAFCSTGYSLLTPVLGKEVTNSYDVESLALLK